MPPRVLILRAPGTNCDVETAFAFERAGAVAERIHIGRWLECPTLVDRYQILCVPGGFSYGDDLAAGRILGNQIRYHLAGSVDRFRDAGKLILGICNGFQVLLRSGVLVGEDASGPLATLTWNDSGKFEARWVSLTACGSRCVMLRGIDHMELPVAHAEGKFVTRDQPALEQLESAGQLVLRYRARDRFATDPVPFPDNPNGSMANVAGVCDTTGRVLGMMPHPERFVDATQHPHWSREPLCETGDGLKIFQNAVGYFL
jgi:phosphoribosylformylglycinamidine synthase